MGSGVIFRRQCPRKMTPDPILGMFAGTVGPTSLFFTGDGRLLVTPGGYEFNPR